MYDHEKIENEINKFFEEHKIYEKLKEKNAQNKNFYFCDGPPYVTGHIHPGTAWNKIIKDTICRYWRAQGRNVRAQPGYDTHGLPIEVKVEQELGIKKKNEIEQYGLEKFVEKCKSFVNKYIIIMTEQFKRLGVWMDWENPYITYRDSYIESSWNTLKYAYDKGLMHEGVYVLPFCYRCETTIANYELEYGEETDPSIYVKFKIKNKENEYLIIWTTTPWTLVGNMAVMANPLFTYVKAKIDDEIWICAKERLDIILSTVGKSAAILEEFSGKKLENLEYVHPLQGLIKKQTNRRIVFSDEYVSLEEGTGLVHCAPGHGQEDFLVGKKYNLEIFSPVDETGRYTEEGGIYQGQNVRETNKEIITALKEKNLLVHSAKIRHRYPHCWRCKTPLIFRATNQWFILISKLKERMLLELENSEWSPKFAKERFKEFVVQAPDWCVSRQRYWGIPLPIWRCTKCSEIKVIGSKKELSEKTLKELHRPYIDEISFKCEKCNSQMNRIKDVLDVWFDSGNAVWASLDKEEKEKWGEQADFILEGQDQIRGWFYSLLGSGLLHYEKIPYKQVLMHGFFVDEKGEKMSKSLGNFVPLEEILNKYGADSFRLWGMSNTLWDELKFNWNELKETYNDLNILFNLSIFLERFYPKKRVEKADFYIEDVWILSRVNTTLKEFHKSFETYEPNRGVKALRKFLVDDLSKFYMKIAKNRISSNDNEQGAVYAVYLSFFITLKMFAIVSPFLSEHIYQNFFRKYEKKESIVFFGLDAVNESTINTGLEKRMQIGNEIISQALRARQKSGIGLRWPLGKVCIQSTSAEIKESSKEFSEIFKKLLNVKEILIIETEPEGDYEIEAFEGGKIFLSKELTQSLYEEGLCNELKRRIQQIRKELGLVEKDSILIELDCKKELEIIFKNFEANILKETNTESISYGLPEGSESKTFEIDGRKIKIKVQKKNTK